MPSAADQSATLLDIYDEAVVEVHGYLFARCRDRSTAEDLTADVFMGAVDGIRRSVPSEVTTAWLIGIARHKLVDHWRRVEREQRRLRAVADDPAERVEDDPWDVELDALAAHDTLARLGANHRAALTLRYLDGLSVAEVAAAIDRTVHATEALLVRAKQAFRQLYGPGGRSS
ncbi:MAG: RNA polymerase sigma factor [Ilumatobacteraceae bacterium]